MLNTLIQQVQTRPGLFEIVRVVATPVVVYFLQALVLLHINRLYCVVLYISQLWVWGGFDGLQPSFARKDTKPNFEWRVRLYVFESLPRDLVGRAPA